MNPSPFGRILWKEARAQFSLWLALVIGALLLQTVIVVFGHPSATSLQTIAAAIFVLTSCFAVASLALLFTGETEDGTRDWLQQLPIRPRTLIGAKLTFTLLATLLYFAAAWATGALSIVLGGKSLASMYDVEIGWAFALKSLSGLVVWGLLFAFICRRVMFALLGTVIAELLTVAVTDNLYGHGLVIPFDDPSTADLARTITYAAVLAIVFVVDVVLAFRWANGGGGTIAIAPRTVRMLSAPLAAWRARTWLRLVTWAAQRGSLSAREIAVLVWREVRAAAPFAVIWCLVGLLVTDFLGLLTGAFWESHPFQLVFLLATPALCGLMTCVGDQRQQTFRFLAERGVSPSQVWVIKQCVWLPLAIIIVMLFLRWDSTVAEQLRSSGSSPETPLVMRAIAAIHVPVLAAPQAGQWWYNRPEDVALQNQFLWVTGLLLYAAGQCAGFWIRRSILAVAAVIVAAPLIAAWNTILVLADVPLSLASLPLTIALMAATLIGASAWLRGRDSWKLRFVRLAAIGLPVCAVATVAAAHRAYSIPKVDSDFPFPDAADLSRFNMQTMVTVGDPAWSQQWSHITRPYIDVGQTRRDSPTLPDLADRRLELLKLAERIKTDTPRLDFLVLSPDRRILVAVLMQALTNEHVLALEASRSQVDLSAAGKWADFEAGLRITRYLAEESQSAEQWIECLRASQPLFKAIVEWSHRADQTPEALQQAFDFLTTDLVKPITAREMAVNRYAFYSQLLQQRGPKWDEIENELRTQGRIDVAAGNSTTAAALQPGFERERVLRLLGHATNDFLSNRTSIVDALQPRGTQLGRWAATTPLLPVNVETEIYPEAFAIGPQQPFTVEGVFLSVHTQEAGTALVVALQRHRLLHGEFPAQLSTVIPPQYSSGWPFMDRQSQTPFGYEPKGLPGDLYLAGGRVLRAGQPLLWATGFGNGRIGQTGVDVRTRMETSSLIPLDLPVVPRGAYVATGNELQLPQGDFQFHEARPDQIEFINAGATPTW